MSGAEGTSAAAQKAAPSKLLNRSALAPIYRENYQGGQ
jgi:hypothetical protein